jgi:hypothetical protein
MRTVSKTPKDPPPWALDLQQKLVKVEKQNHRFKICVSGLSLVLVVVVVAVFLTNSSFSAANPGTCLPIEKGGTGCDMDELRAALGLGTNSAGPVPVNSGGTGMSVAPNMLTNLGSTSGQSPFQLEPRPGVTGTLGVGNGGTGVTSLGALVTALNPNLSTAIPASSDLNSYQTTGMYNCAANATVTTLTNSPTTNAFSMLVEKHAGVKQTVTEYLAATPRTWVRNYYSGSWGAWKQVMIADSGYTLPVGQGGTGQTTFTAGNIITGNGTSGLNNVTPQAMRNTMGLGNTTGALPAANGGTGLTSITNITANLGSTTAANALTTNIGVSGTLGLANGGTGQNNGSSTTYTSRGLTYYCHRWGRLIVIGIAGTTTAATSIGATLGTLPSGYQPESQTLGLPVLVGTNFLSWRVESNGVVTSDGTVPTATNVYGTMILFGPS